MGDSKSASETGGFSSPPTTKRPPRVVDIFKDNRDPDDIIWHATSPYQVNKAVDLVQAKGKETTKIDPVTGQPMKTGSRDASLRKVRG